MESTRERILKERRALSQPELKALSERVCARAISALQNAKLNGLKIALYSPLSDELRVSELENWLGGRGARLLYPRINDRINRVLEFVDLTDRQKSEDSWELGPYGIREPRAQLPAAEPRELDLLFVPGAAFTASGQRVGMGASFYDRYLPQTRPEAVRAALAFDFQVVSALEQEPWDQPVHWVLTETRDLRAMPLLIEKLTGSQ